MVDPRLDRRFRIVSDYTPRGDQPRAIAELVAGELARALGLRVPELVFVDGASALADAEPLVTELFQYRFDERAGEGIAGHSFGNLFITAMAEVTGNMEAAITETSRVLAVRGQIVPSTLDDVTLAARFPGGKIVRGLSFEPTAIRFLHARTGKVLVEVTNLK